MLNQGICRLLLILLLTTMPLATTVGAQDDTVFRIEVE